MQKHFVTFYSPGTFVAETTTKSIVSWDIKLAVEMMAEVSERYGATPYGFVFTTRSRGDNDLDSREVARSPMHYSGCKIETLADIKAKGDPRDRILISNMECNGWDRVATTTKGWKWTQPLRSDDVIVEVA